MCIIIKTIDNNTSYAIENYHCKRVHTYNLYFGDKSYCVGFVKYWTAVGGIYGTRVELIKSGN